ESAQEQFCRHVESGWKPRRRGDGGLLPRALRQGLPVGSPRHRGYRFGVGRRQGVDRAARAAACRVPDPARRRPGKLRAVEKTLRLQRRRQIARKETNMPRLPTVDVADHSSYVSTGHLPVPELVQGLVAEAHERFKSSTEGENSKVYPALARVPSDLFGICVAGTSRH